MKTVKEINKTWRIWHHLEIGLFYLSSGWRKDDPMKQKMCWAITLWWLG